MQNYFTLYFTQLSQAIATETAQYGVWGFFNTPEPFTKIPLIVAVLIIFIIIFFGCQWWGLYRKKKPIVKTLDDITDFISQFKTEISSQELEQIRDKFSKLPTLDGVQAIKDAWHEFDETLTFDPGKDKVHNTYQAEAFFNKRIIENALHLAWYRSVPGILTGLGLLGTFVALLIGLHFIHVGSSGKVDGIEDLINGLSGKFLSSIVGLLGSLGFIWIEKRVIKQLEQKLIKFQDRLNKILSRITPEKILLDIAKEMQQQTAAFQTFNTDLSGHLKESFKEGIGPELKEMVKAIEDLKQATDAMRQQKEESATTAIQELVENFKSTLTHGANSEIQGLTQALSNAAGFLNGLDEKNRQMEERMAQILGNLDHSIQNQREQSSVQIESVNQAMQQLVQNMESGSTHQLEKFQGSLQEVIHQTSNWSNQIAEQFNQLIGTQSQQAQGQQTQMQQTVETMEQMMRQLVQNMESGSTHQLEKFQGSLQEVIHQTSNWSNQIAEQFNQLIGTQSQQAQGQQTQMQQTVETMEQMMRQLVQTMETSSSHQLEKFQGSLQEVTTQTATWSNQVNDQFKQMLTMQEQQAQGQQTQIQHTIESLMKQLEDHASKNSANVDSTVSLLLDKMSVWTNQVQEQLQRTLAAQEAQSKTLFQGNEQLSNSFSKLRDLIQQNREYFSQLEQTTKNLQNTSSNFNATAAIVKETEGKITYQMNQLSSLMQRYENSMSHSEELLQTQKKVYETLDNSLKNILQQLQEGVEGYTSTIRDNTNTFFASIATHLSQATGTLAHTIENLDEPLESLSEMLEKATLVKR